ncbi:ral guanine nucleotide dissociation stimulator isoform X2 [Cricetulus griseus]|uniref:Ral guanine nucleotide dissociation stimulator isoform X2 n=1 Tax=Cricetulus griseus TaxID=10029 RepID=A0A9J7GUY1_CRIGR|nr:ral guanine nucleotide dissociation stimulator isoform X2 [Cricetulus griseus]
MFSCCFKATPGSEPKKDKSEGRGGVWKHRVHSCLQCLWPFGGKETNLTQGSHVQDHKDQVEKESAPKVQEGSCRESRISAVMVARLVNHLVPSLQGGDPFFVPAFLCIYQRFATTQQVLDLLLERYAHLRLFCEEDEQIKKTICTFLDTWMDKKPEEFCQSSALTIVKQMKNFLVVNMPYSDLTVRVRMLLTHLEEEEATGSEAKNEEASETPTSATRLSTSIDLRRRAFAGPELEVC